jgi:type IV secretory pathway VirB2 component (pilin)
MTIAMFVVLVVAALACLALIFGMDTSPSGGWHGSLAWLSAIALLLTAACYLLTLAVGLVQP